MDILTIKLESERFLLKRIIALPYDTVHIHNGRVYVNDQIVDEIPTEYSGLADTPYTLGEGEYFVLGDNRSNSLDSRYPDVGIIKKDQICEKIIFVN